MGDFEVCADDRCRAVPDCDHPVQAVVHFPALDVELPLCAEHYRANATAIADRGGVLLVDLLEDCRA